MSDSDDATLPSTPATPSVPIPVAVAPDPVPDELAVVKAQLDQVTRERDTFSSFLGCIQEMLGAPDAEAAVNAVHELLHGRVAREGLALTHELSGERGDKAIHAFRQFFEGGGNLGAVRTVGRAVLERARVRAEAMRKPSVF